MTSFEKIMTQEHKELLLKDLCARLPYRVKCKYYDCCEGDYDEGTICGFERQEYIQIDGVCINIEEVKPYLFPLSSMTEEQREEYRNIDNRAYSCPMDCAHIPTSDRMDWLNAHHFDYRGLIPMGLANNAVGLNIY